MLTFPYRNVRVRQNNKVNSGENNRNPSKINVPTGNFDQFYIENMPIEKEILDMFEFSRNQKNTSSIVNHFDEWALSQQRSVPTDQLSL